MKIHQKHLIITIVFFFLIGACKDEKIVDCNVFQWSYEGGSGPANWPDCHTDCDGQIQSPIDIKGAELNNSLPVLSANYESVPINLTNNGHTIEFEYEPGSSLTYLGIDFQGLEYELLQFHFHTESEHTIIGEQYPLEVHLVHKDTSTGKLVVIGILFEIGNTNPFLQSFIDDLPDEKGEHFSSANMVNVYELLPQDRRYYSYGGSLTTPPCSEIVHWIVLRTPVQISNVQLQQFVNILHENNRPIQPLNGRVIYESTQ